MGSNKTWSSGGLDMHLIPRRRVILRYIRRICRFSMLAIFSSITYWHQVGWQYHSKQEIFKSLENRLNIKEMPHMLYYMFS